MLKNLHRPGYGEAMCLHLLIIGTAEKRTLVRAVIAPEGLNLSAGGRMEMCCVQIVNISQEYSRETIIASILRLCRAKSAVIKG